MPKKTDPSRPAQRPTRGITVRERNGRYQWQVRLNGQETRSGTCDDLNEAWELAEQTRRKILDGTIDVYARKILREWTLTKLIKYYLEQGEQAKLLMQIHPKHGYIHGYRLKRSFDHEKQMLEAFKDRNPGLCSKTLDNDLAKDFQADCDRRVGEGISPDAVRRQLNPIRHIWKIAKRKLHLPLGDPFNDLEFAKAIPRRARRALKSEERQRLLQATLSLRTEKQGYLWRALIVTALETAMRGIEMLKAKWGDVDLDKLLWYIPADNAKNGKERTLPISKVLQDNLEAYQDHIPEQDQTASSPVFQSQFKRTKHGKPVALSYMAKDHLFRRLLEKAEITDFTFHELRHTAATIFDQEKELTGSQNDYMRNGVTNSQYIHTEIQAIRAKLDARYDDKDHTVSDVERCPLQEWIKELDEQPYPYRVVVYKWDDTFTKFMRENKCVFNTNIGYDHLTRVGRYKSLEDAAKYLNMDTVTLAYLLKDGNEYANDEHVAVLKRYPSIMKHTHVLQPTA